ncbi:DoxX family protein [Streptomyces sp. B21-083]|uniref:DoxX family protein n=1 Tax=Streptomyces sp. B21-083 TaxID=3039410 RepID=UPI002FF37513
MFIAYVVVAVLLTLLLVASGSAKVKKDPKLVDGLGQVGVSQGMLPFLAAAEFAGAVGLIVGMWWWPLGVAAAIGVVLYFVGAVGAHLRVKDIKGSPNAFVALLLAIAALTLRLASS